MHDVPDRALSRIANIAQQTPSLGLLLIALYLESKNRISKSINYVSEKQL
jgi:hypothetical protein